MSVSAVDAEDNYRRWLKNEADASAPRRKKSADALLKLLGGSTADEMPSVGFCLSGGGWRAMTSGCALFDALSLPLSTEDTFSGEEVKLMDCFSHAFGLSGGSWLLFTTLAGGRDVNPFHSPPAIATAEKNHEEDPLADEAEPIRGTLPSKEEDAPTAIMHPWLYGSSNYFSPSIHRYDGLRWMLKHTLVNNACHRGLHRQRAGYVSTKIGADATIAAALSCPRLGESLVERWSNFIANDILNFVDDGQLTSAAVKTDHRGNSTSSVASGSARNLEEQEATEKKKKAAAAAATTTGAELNEPMETVNNPVEAKIKLAEDNKTLRSRRVALSKLRELIANGDFPFVVCTAIADRLKRNKKKQEGEDEPLGAQDESTSAANLAPAASAAVFSSASPADAPSAATGFRGKLASVASARSLRRPVGGGATATATSAASNAANPPNSNEPATLEERAVERLYDWIELSPFFARNPETGFYTEDVDSALGYFTAMNPFSGSSSVVTGAGATPTGDVATVGGDEGKGSLLSVVPNPQQQTLAASNVAAVRPPAGATVRTPIGGGATKEQHGGEGPATFESPTPLRLHHLMAICGSAFACDVARVLPAGVSRAVSKRVDLANFRNPIIGRGTTTVAFPESASASEESSSEKKKQLEEATGDDGEGQEPTTKKPNEELLGTLRDAGIDFNVPLPSMLDSYGRRSFDVILIMDAGGASSNAFELARAVELGYLDLMPGSMDPNFPFTQNERVRVYRGKNGFPSFVYFLGLTDRGTHQIIHSREGLYRDTDKLRDTVVKQLIPTLVAEIRLAKARKMAREAAGAAAASPTGVPLPVADHSDAPFQKKGGDNAAEEEELSTDMHLSRAGSSILFDQTQRGDLRNAKQDEDEAAVSEAFSAHKNQHQMSASPSSATAASTFYDGRDQEQGKKKVHGMNDDSAAGALAPTLNHLCQGLVAAAAVQGRVRDNFDAFSVIEGAVFGSMPPAKRAPIVAALEIFALQHFFPPTQAELQQQLQQSDASSGTLAARISACDPGILELLLEFGMVRQRVELQGRQYGVSPTWADYFAVTSIVPRLAACVKDQNPQQAQPQPVSGTAAEQESEMKVFDELLFAVTNRKLSSTSSSPAAQHHPSLPTASRDTLSNFPFTNIVGPTSVVFALLGKVVARIAAGDEDVDCLAKRKAPGAVRINFLLTTCKTILTTFDQTWRTVFASHGVSFTSVQKRLSEAKAEKDKRQALEHVEQVATDEVACIRNLTRFFSEVYVGLEQAPQLQGMVVQALIAAAQRVKSSEEPEEKKQFVSGLIAEHFAQAGCIGIVQGVLEATRAAAATDVVTTTTPVQHWLSDKLLEKICGAAYQCEDEGKRDQFLVFMAVRMGKTLSFQRACELGCVAAAQFMIRFGTLEVVPDKSSNEEAGHFKIVLRPSPSRDNREAVVATLGSDDPMVIRHNGRRKRQLIATLLEENADTPEYCNWVQRTCVDRGFTWPFLTPNVAAGQSRGLGSAGSAGKGDESVLESIATFVKDTRDSDDPNKVILGKIDELEGRAREQGAAVQAKVGTAMGRVKNFALGLRGFRSGSKAQSDPSEGGAAPGAASPTRHVDPMAAAAAPTSPKNSV